MWWSVARAAKDPVELQWDVKLTQPPEPGPYGLSDVPQTGHHFLAGRFDRERAESAEVDDGWFRTTCTLTHRSIGLTLSWTPSHFPEHLPEDLTCTVGRYRVRVVFHGTLPQYPTAAEQWTHEDTEFPLRLPETGPGGAAQRTLDLGLPSEVPWVEASAFLRSGDGRWGDGACQVRPGDRPLLVVSYTHRMQGTGTCEVADGAGAPHTFRFRREDLPLVAAPP